jgi:diguanylate cyclase (GGDEF)-like protein
MPSSSSIPEMTDRTSSLPLWLTLLTLAEQATRDHLTGLYNRRYFDDTLQDHIAAAKRYERELSLVLFDLDGFKQINDTRGHDAGDAALRQFAERLKSTSREADIICRYGGDEFAAILPETDKEQAQHFVERIRGGSAATPTIDSEAAVPPSFKAGIAALPCDDLVVAADADLLARKRGR